MTKVLELNGIAATHKDAVRSVKTIINSPVEALLQTQPNRGWGAECTYTRTFPQTWQILRRDETSCRVRSSAVLLTTFASCSRWKC